MPCSRCRLPYADTVPLMPVVGPHPLAGSPVCGICALDIVNEMHGTRMTEFRGELAEAVRFDAMEWRRRHPAAKPVAHA